MIALMKSPLPPPILEPEASSLPVLTLLTKIGWSRPSHLILPRTAHPPALYPFDSWFSFSSYLDPHHIYLRGPL